MPPPRIVAHARGRLTLDTSRMVMALWRSVIRRVALLCALTALAVAAAQSLPAQVGEAQQISGTGTPIAMPAQTTTAATPAASSVVADATPEATMTAIATRLLTLTATPARTPSRTPTATATARATRTLTPTAT